MTEEKFIHRFMPGEPGRSTLLLLHGTGGNENDLVPVGKLLAPGAALLSPRGRVLERGMNRFFRRLAEGIFDIEDLIFRTHELADWVGEAARQYGFDASTVWAAGFSNGANIAAAMMLLRPEVLRGAVLFHPMPPLEPETAPDLAARPVFIGAGQTDPLSGPAETQRLAQLLRGFGAPVTIHWTPGGHALTNSEVTAARDWLEPQLGS
jgi:predicted esterase